MKVRLLIDTQLAVLAGKNRTGYAVVDVDVATLTEQQRQRLAKCATFSSQSEPEADFYLDSTLTYSQGDEYREIRRPCDGTAEEVIRILDALSAADAAVAARLKRESEEKAAYEAEEAAKRKAAKDAAIAELLAMSPEERFLDATVIDQEGFRSINLNHRLRDDVTGGYSRHNTGWPHKDVACEELKAAAADVDRRLQAFNAELKARKDAETAAGLAKLREWGEVNGSELLKARIAGGFGFADLCRTEYAQSLTKPLLVHGITPARDDQPQKVEDRTRPTLSEITAFQRIKEHIGNRGECTLIRCKYERTDDYDDEDQDSDSVWDTECEIDVTCPDGAEKTVYLKLS